MVFGVLLSYTSTVTTFPFCICFIGSKVCPRPWKYRPSVLDEPFAMPFAINGSSSVGASCLELSLAAVTDGSI